MFYVANIFCLQIDDIDVLVGHIHHHHLPIIQHPEGIYDIRVLILEQHFPVFVNMHDALIGAGVDHPWEDKGVVEGGWEAENFHHWILQHQLMVFLF